jgi:hypothetical protein
VSSPSGAGSGVDCGDDALAFGHCHSRASGNPVTPVFAINQRRRLLDRPVKPGDDKERGRGANTRNRP